MGTYTPAIYKQLGGTTVAIDLSALADIGEVQDSVQTLSEQTSDIAESAARIETGNSNVGTLVTEAQAALSERFDSAEQTLATHEANAVARHEELLEAIAGMTVGDDEHPELDEDDGPILLQLLKAQAFVLGEKPVPQNLARDIAAQLKLLEPGGELADAFNSAINGGSSNSWPARSRRFWALHDLIEDVAEA